MKILIAILFASISTVYAQDDREATPIYTYTVSDIYGELYEMSSLEGKKVMVVNTASKCGNTPQYKDLQKLYDTYKEKDFIIIGFPANNFMKQEPGDNEDIIAFCEENYGVTFPMMSKISVKGTDIHPFYQYLTQKSLNGYADSKVKWNFQKYLVGEEGFIEMVVDPRTLPDDPAIISWIED